MKILCVNPPKFVKAILKFFKNKFKKSEKASSE
jgi:hypothetical protein